jgi:hypothetical protein
LTVAAGQLDVSLRPAGSLGVILRTVPELLLKITFIGVSTALRRISPSIAGDFIAGNFDVSLRTVGTFRVVFQAIAESLLNVAFGCVLAPLRRNLARTGVAVGAWEVWNDLRCSGAVALRISLAAIPGNSIRLWQIRPGARRRERIGFRDRFPRPPFHVARLFVAGSAPNLDLLSLLHFWLLDATRLFDSGWGFRLFDPSRLLNPGRSFGLLDTARLFHPGRSFRLLDTPRRFRLTGDSGWFGRPAPGSFNTWSPWGVRFALVLLLVFAQDGPGSAEQRQGEAG